MSRTATLVHDSQDPADQTRHDDQSLPRRLLALGILLVPISAVAGFVGGTAAATVTPAIIALPAALILGMIIWHRPSVGLYVLFGAAITIEQFPVLLGEAGSGPVTALLPAFREVAPGLSMNLVEIVAVLTVATVILQALRDRRSLLPRSGSLKLLSVVLLLVVVYLLVGWSRGGDVNKSLWEIRPYFYLTVAFILASLLITSMRQAQSLLWILVIGSGAKAAYGMVIWFSVRTMEPRPEAVLAHEESFFFGLCLFLTAALWLFKIRGRLRTVATVLMPIVLLADLVNSRRTAWLILGLGILILAAVAYSRLPERRPMIIAGALILAFGSAIYLPLAWDGGGTLAQPARAVRSQIDPDPRDASSNDYRVAENENLYEYIRAQSTLGMGFGLPLTYRDLPDLSDTNEMIQFVPHNTVLHVWLRTGLAGIIAWFTFLAFSLTQCVRLARLSQDRLVAAFGATVAAAMMGYVAMGLVDLGFFWFRNAIAMGVLLGAVQGLASTQSEPRPRAGHLATADGAERAAR